MRAGVLAASLGRAALSLIGPVLSLEALPMLAHRRPAAIRKPTRRDGTIAPQPALVGLIGDCVMGGLVGFFLGVVATIGGVYIVDSMSTSTVASGQVAQANRTIVNWDVAETQWQALKTRAHSDWVKLSAK
jgi:hypothetical protein